VIRHLVHLRDGTALTRSEQARPLEDDHSAEEDTEAHQRSEDVEGQEHGGHPLQWPAI
jgi:hypothetical protein